MKIILATVLLFSITFIHASEEPKPLPKDSKELNNQINEHIAFLKKSGISLDQLKAKYADPVSDLCLEAAWALGSQYDNELYAWAATDLYYEYCMSRWGGGVNTGGDEDY